MANSSIIGIAKNKIIKEFIKDSEIVKAIDSSQITSPEKLKGTHIFDFHQNPNSIKDAKTFITIQVHIPKSFGRSESKTFVETVVEVWIISHVDHMSVNNVPKVTVNRNDYISELIDNRLNGRNGFGIGTLKLDSNIEGSYQTDYLYRKLVFKGTDLNNSLCGQE